MTYQNDDVKQAIMQIQRFLRLLQINSKETVNVPIDGIYGSSTKEAVKKFQKEKTQIISVLYFLRTV